MNSVLKKVPRKHRSFSYNNMNYVFARLGKYIDSQRTSSICQQLLINIAFEVALRIRDIVKSAECRSNQWRKVIVVQTGCQLTVNSIISS